MSGARRTALAGMLCALALTFMLLGGLFPLATFCCPALAGVCLIPVFVECGEKTAWTAYGAIALLALILAPDKESACLFAFLGYYPILRWRILQIRGQVRRVAVRLLLFNAAIAAMYALLLLVLQSPAVAADFAEMNLWLLIASLTLGNVTMLLYDRLLGILTALYVKRRKR